MRPNPHNMTGDDLGLTHFSEAEFREWWDLMDPRLLILVDVLRERSGIPIAISPHRRAIGRHDGSEVLSDHNVDQWGRVFGVDFMPQWRDPRQGNPTVQGQALRFFQLATQIGFTAIGYYPDWVNSGGRKSPGFHLGTRRNRTAGSPATWGRLKKPEGGYADVAAMAAIQLTEERIV